jgi:hypothetical protein
MADVMNLFYHLFNFDYFYAFQYLLSVSDGFYWGFLSLNRFQQMDWDYYVTGSLTQQDWWLDDGIVPLKSQVLYPYTPEGKRLKANKIGHLEMINGEPSRTFLRSVFLRNDIGLTQR